MRLCLALALGLRCCFAQVKAPASKASLEERLNQKEKDVLWEAVAKKDLALLGSTLADDYVEPAEDGVYGKADVLGVVPKITVMEYALDKFKVVRLGASGAIVTYEAVQHWTLDAQDGPT